MTSGATALRAVHAPSRGRSLALALMRLRTLIALILVFAYFSLTTPNFLALPTLVIVAKHVAINAILGIGMTFVIHERAAALSGVRVNRIKTVVYCQKELCLQREPPMHALLDLVENHRGDDHQPL